MRGEVYFVPSGSLHSIENTGAEPAEFVHSFSHEMPEDFGLSSFAGALDPTVLDNTWGLAAAEIYGVTRSPIDFQIGRSTAPAKRIPSPDRSPMISFAACPDSTLRPA